MLAAARMPEFAQCLGFDLTNTFTGYVELFSHFLKGVVSVHVDTETHAQDFSFPSGEVGQYVAGGFFQAKRGGGIYRGFHVAVFDKVAEAGIFIVTDGGFHGDWLFGNLEYFTNFIFRHFQAYTQLFWSGFAAHFLQHLTLYPVDLVDGLYHVYRDTDGACLVGDGACDGLTNPPSSVGGEFVTTAVFELVYGFHQADVAFLNQVEEL